MLHRKIFNTCKLCNNRTLVVDLDTVMDEENPRIIKEIILPNLPNKIIVICNSCGKFSEFELNKLCPTLKYAYGKK